MRKTMKFLPVIFAFFALVACKKDDDPVEPPVPKEAAIVSFGFFQEDNESLIADYPATINGTNIEVAIPAEADFTELVARFETTSGDVVTVKGEPQVSGETVNDFSSNLEYLVNEETTNVIYLVTVNKMADAIWSSIGVYGEDLAGDISMAIDPTTSTPYIAYISERESSSDQKLNLIGYENGAWTRVGAMDFNSARARTIDLAFSADGAPVIAAGDDALDDTQVSVFSFDNSWSALGGGSATGIESEKTAVTVGDNGEVYVFYTSEVRDDTRRNVFGKVFQDGAWSDFNITGRTGAVMGLWAKVVNGDVYVGILNYGDLQSISVYKYSNGAWTTLADKMKAAPENFIYYYGGAMDVDNEGNVYMAYAENNGDETDLQLKVRKYSVADGNWSTVGALIATPELRSYDIAVNAYGSPVLLYKNEAENPIAVLFDSEINNWGVPYTLASVEADDLNLVAAPNGVLYASYLVDDQVYLDKYASPDGE